MPTTQRRLAHHAVVPTLQHAPLCPAAPWRTAPAHAWSAASRWPAAPHPAHPACHVSVPRQHMMWVTQGVGTQAHATRKGPHLSAGRDGALHHVQPQQAVPLALAEQARRVAQRAQARHGVRLGQRLQLLCHDDVCNGVRGVSAGARTGNKVSRLGQLRVRICGGGGGGGRRCGGGLALLTRERRWGEKAASETGERHRQARQRTHRLRDRCRGGVLRGARQAPRVSARHAQHATRQPRAPPTLGTRTHAAARAHARHAPAPKPPRAPARRPRRAAAPRAPR
jgi:hypothetical protein